METVTSTEPWKMLAALASQGDRLGLEACIESMGPTEAFRALLHLAAEQRQQVLTTLSPEEAADLIEDIPQAHAADLIQALASQDAASILNEMESAEQADVLGELDEDDAEAILSEMEPGAALDARQLIAYPSDSAGGLMTTEYLAYEERTTVWRVVEDLKHHADQRPHHEAHLYVVSAHGKLVGVLDMRDLVHAAASETLANILRSPVFVVVGATIDDLEALFARYDFNTVPVVDAGQQLVGVVQRSKVAESVTRRSESDYMKSQGIVGGDEIRSQPVFARARRRLSWLSVNIVLNIIAASVIALYQETLAAVIALAVFLPIVSDMSGCSGNQAVAVSMRELALGVVKPHEMARVWWQEIKVGVLNGVVLGVLIALVALAWQGNPYLGLVVSSALALNTMIAVSIGGTVPLLLKRLSIDPAVASGPILTTVTDMCGFFLILSLATLMLPLLL